MGVDFSWFHFDPLSSGLQFSSSKSKVGYPCSFMYAMSFSLPKVFSYSLRVFLLMRGEVGETGPDSMIRTFPPVGGGGGILLKTSCKRLLVVCAADGELGIAADGEL